MNKKIRWVTAAFLIVVSCIMTFTGTYYYMYAKTQKISQTESIFSKLTAVNDIINERYIGKVDNETLVDMMLKGYTAGLGDPYAEYFTKEEYRAFTKERAGNFEGIGISAMATQDEKGIYVRYIYGNSPAQKGGVKIGDVIIKVGSENVSDIGYSEGVSKLRDKVGTIAKFTVLRDGKEIPFEIKRESFTKKTVESKLIGDTAYIRILEFDSGTPADFTKAVDELLKAEPVGFIFDVRYNPGGGLDSVIGVLDRLLPPCTVITAEKKKAADAKANDESYIERSETKDEIELDYPAVILVNEETASAAEVFSSALRDYNQIKLVGKKTYGKGVGQSIINLPDGSGIKITTFRYLPPSGISYDGIGLKPDIEVGFPQALYKTFYSLAPKDDPQLVAAVKELGGTIETNSLPNESGKMAVQ